MIGGVSSTENRSAVAGIPTSLAAIDQGLEPYDPDRVHGYHLGLQRIQRMLSLLSSLPLAERLRVPGSFRTRHPARLGTLRRDGPRLTRRLAGL